MLVSSKSNVKSVCGKALEPKPKKRTQNLNYKQKSVEKQGDQLLATYLIVTNRIKKKIHANSYSKTNA